MSIQSIHFDNYEYDLEIDLDTHDVLVSVKYVDEDNSWTDRYLEAYDDTLGSYLCFPEEHQREDFGSGNWLTCRFVKSTPKVSKDVVSEAMIPDYANRKDLDKLVCILDPKGIPRNIHCMGVNGIGELIIFFGTASGDIKLSTEELYHKGYKWCKGWGSFPQSFKLETSS